MICDILECDKEAEWLVFPIGKSPSEYAHVCDGHILESLDADYDKFIIERKPTKEKSTIDAVLEDARKRLEDGEEPWNVAGVLRDHCPDDLSTLAYRLNHQLSGCTSRGDVYMLIELIEKSFP